VLKPLAKNFPSKAGEQNLLDGRVHSFRHYFCSRCAREGIAVQTLMLWLGHQDSSMIRHYYHLHDDQAQLQMNKLKSISDSAQRSAG
jgi:integrase